MLPSLSPSLSPFPLLSCNFNINYNNITTGLHAPAAPLQGLPPPQDCEGLVSRTRGLQTKGAKTFSSRILIRCVTVPHDTHPVGCNLYFCQRMMYESLLGYNDGPFLFLPTRCDAQHTLKLAGAHTVTSIHNTRYVPHTTHRTRCIAQCAATQRNAI